MISVGGGSATPNRPLEPKEIRELNRHLKGLNLYMRDLLIQNQKAAMGGGGSGGGGGGAMPGGGGGGGGGKMAGMVSKLTGGPIGMALGAIGIATMFLPMLQSNAGGANREVQQLNTGLGTLKESALSAKHAIAQMMADLQASAAASGTKPTEIMALTAGYSRIGSQDPLGAGQDMAARLGRASSGMAIGQPDQGHIVASSMLGMGATAASNMSASDFQNKLVEQLRLMTKEQRESSRTRGFLSQLVGEGQVGPTLMMGSMSQKGWDQVQGWQQQNKQYAGSMFESMEERNQQLLSIQTNAQMREMRVRMGREYLRTGGGREPMGAQIKDQITEQFQRAQMAFWVSMLPVLEEFRNVMRQLGNPGGAIQTFGDVMVMGGKALAIALSEMIAAFLFAAGVIQSIFAVWNSASALSSGDWRRAWEEIQKPAATFSASNRMTGNSPQDTEAWQGYQSPFGSEKLDLALTVDGNMADIVTAGVQDATRNGKQIELTPRTPRATPVPVP